MNDGPLRYYVTLDPGYIALGSRANETRACIDHDCALLRAYDRAAMARRLEADGLPEAPRIDRFGVNVAHFDVATVVQGLGKLGARIVSPAPERLHFRCPDGLGVELLPVDPARIWGLA